MLRLNLFASSVLFRGSISDINKDLLVKDFMRPNEHFANTLASSVFFSQR